MNPGHARLAPAVVVEVASVVAASALIAVAMAVVVIAVAVVVIDVAAVVVVKVVVPNHAGNISLIGSIAISVVS